MTVIVNRPPKFSNPPTLPDWIPPLDTGQPSAEDLNDLSAVARTNFAARNTPIPVPYGRDRFFGQPFVVTLCEDSGCLNVAYGIGEGEIEGYESIIVDSTDVITAGTGYFGIKDRGFESGGTNHWSGGTVETTNPRSGTYHGQVLVGAGGPNLISDEFTPAPAEGTVMRVKGYMARNESALPDANASIGIRFYDSGLAAVGGRTTPTAVEGGTILALSGTVGYQELEGTVTVPATAVYYKFDFGESGGTTGSWHCDDASTQVLAEDNPALSADAMEFVLYAGEASQPPDGILASVLTGYTDTCDGLAYIVGRFPPGTTSGFPRLETIYQGRKVYDPRKDSTSSVYDVTLGVSTHRENDPTTWQYSTNPAICFRDVILNYTTWSIIDEGLAELADYNDELVDGHPRREIGLTITKPDTIEKWIKGFRTYMGGFIGWDDGALRVVPNKPVSLPGDVALAITADDIVKNSLRVKRRSLRNTPNSVAVDYRDSSGSRWRTERVQSDSVRLTSGAEQRRLSRVSLPGIHNATQAQREATERLNWYLTDLEVTFSMFDEGWQLQTGSIITLTHPIGFTAKEFRVTRLTGESGRWTIDATEYDPAAYSTEVVADPTIPDTNLGDPLNPPTVTNLAAQEELYTTKEGNTGSRVRITFDKTGYSFFSQYLIEGWVDGTKVYQINTQSNEVVTPGVEQLVNDTAIDYEVRVYIQSPFATGAVTTALTIGIDSTQGIKGKLAPPNDVSTLTAKVIAADAVQINWSAVADIDIWRYEVRYGGTGDTWASGSTLLGRYDTLNASLDGLTLGTYRFFVKALDSVGNYSANAKTVDITLQQPAPVTTLAGFEVASEVRLSWSKPTGGSGYVSRYRVAYDTIPVSNEITLDVVDTLRFQTKDVPEGTWRFLVYSQDDFGNETTTADTIDIEVTSDADAFLADSYNFVQATTVTDPARVETNGSLTNFVEYVLRTDNRQFWVTNMGDTFTSSPSDFNTYSAEALANYHSSGAATWLSETVDFGLLLTGSWNFTHDITALNGTVTVALELSTDNATFTSFTGAAKGEYRYARVRITTAGDSTGFVKSPIMSLKINVVPLEENGFATTSATDPKTINLSKEYTAVKEVNVQPRDKTDSLMAVVDNIIIGQNTAVQNNTTAYLDGGDIADLEFSAAQSATIEFWMKHSGGSQGVTTVMGKRNGTAAGWAIQCAESTENVSITVDDGTDEVTLSMVDACPNDGDYHHIAFVIDRTADVLRGYADGVADASTPSIAAVGALSSSTAPFRIFANNTGGAIWQNGIVDEVRIWDDIRTSTEINDNLQNELDMTQTQANLLHYWQMNGEVGTTVADTGGGIEDRDAVNNDDLDASAVSAITFIDPGSSGNNIKRINSFDTYVFDIFGQQLLEAVQWNWKAV